MTQVLITIDTELSIRAHKHGAELDENYRAAILGEAGGAAFGVGYQARTLAAAGLTGVFFLDPGPCALFGTDWLKRCVALVREGGHEAQLHLHPGWRRFVPGNADWKAARSDLLGDYDLATQTAMLEEALGWLVEAGATPTAFRAGNYAADDRTLQALAAIGIGWDSSFNPVAKSCRITLPKAQIEAVATPAGVMEAPITAIAEGTGLRFAQINAISAWEARAALEHARANGHGLFNIVSHSFELINRWRTRPNREVVGRWEALVGYLADNRATLPTRGFDTIEARAGGGAARLPANRLRQWHRTARQAVAQLRYEAA